MDPRMKQKDIKDYIGFKLEPDVVHLYEPYDFESYSRFTISNLACFPITYKVLLIKEPEWKVTMTKSDGVLKEQESITIKVTLQPDPKKRTADLFYINVLTTKDKVDVQKDWHKERRVDVQCKKILVLLNGVFSPEEREKKNQLVKQKCEEEEEERRADARRFKLYKLKLDQEYLTNRGAKYTYIQPRNISGKMDNVMNEGKVVKHDEISNPFLENHKFYTSSVKDVLITKAKTPKDLSKNIVQDSMAQESMVQTGQNNYATTYLKGKYDANSTMTDPFLNDDFVASSVKDGLSENPRQTKPCIELSFLNKQYSPSNLKQKLRNIDEILNSKEYCYKTREDAVAQINESKRKEKMKS